MTKKYRFLPVCLFFFISSAFARTITVPSPGIDMDIQPAIQAAVDTALNGDIIILPAGNFILNKCVVVTKFISIKGQGVNSTKLYRSSSVSDAVLESNADWKEMFRYTINSLTSSKLSISDIYFKSKQPSVVNGDGLSLAADVGVKIINCVDFIITRCKFEYFGIAGVSIYHDDTKAGGVIFNNEFHHNVKGPAGLGFGYGVVIYGSNQQWVSVPKFGTSNFIFVENNLFEYHRHSIAAGGGALYVFRYNTVNNNVAANSAHAIDAHAAALSGVENYYATRAIEVYNNRIINTTFKDDSGISGLANGTTIVPGKSLSWLVEACIRPRGGEALVHHNYIKGYRFGVGPIAEGPLDSTYPDRYQTGYASGKQYGSSHTGVSSNRGAGDLFIWSDTFDLYDPSNSNNVYFYNYSPVQLVSERDYHTYAKGGYGTYYYPHPLRSYAPAAFAGLVSESVTAENLPITKNSLEVRPNPGNGVFTLDINLNDKESFTLIVSDAGGKVKQQQKLNLQQGNSLVPLNLTSFSKGVYFISLAGRKNNFTKRVIVQ